MSRFTGRVRIWVFGLTLAAAAGALPRATASPGEAPRTLEDCFRAALERSETVASQLELVIQAEEHYRQAVGGVLPSLSAVAQQTVQQIPTSSTASRRPLSSASATRSPAGTCSTATQTGSAHGVPFAYPASPDTGCGLPWATCTTPSAPRARQES